jgi:hypothetical protein
MDETLEEIRLKIARCRELIRRLGKNSAARERLKVLIDEMESPVDLGTIAGAAHWLNRVSVEVAARAQSAPVEPCQPLAQAGATAVALATRLIVHRCGVRFPS